MTSVSSRARVRDAPFHCLNAWDSNTLADSQHLSLDVRVQRGLSGQDLRAACANVNTDISAAIANLEEVTDNQSGFIQSGGTEVSHLTTTRSGGKRHIPGNFDGTDEPGNIGFAEAAFLHSDPTSDAFAQTTSRDQGAYQKAHELRGDGPSLPSFPTRLPSYTYLTMRQMAEQARAADSDPRLPASQRFFPSIQKREIERDIEQEKKAAEYKKAKAERAKRNSKA